MREYNVMREDFGKICVSQRQNALLNPNAIMKKPLSMDDYLNARMISNPIALFDCVMPVAGAEAFLMMGEEDAKALKIPYAHLCSTLENHNAFAEDPIQMRGGWAQDCDELYQMAGIKVDDIDLLQTYDDYPVIVMMQLEDLGFCQKGEAKEFIRAHDLTVQGDFPHNSSGGQLSAGQAGAGGGYIGIVEALYQLTGEAEQRQIKDLDYALVSGFGMINYDRGVCSSAAILSKGSRQGDVSKDRPKGN